MTKAIAHSCYADGAPQLVEVPFDAARWVHSRPHSDVLACGCRGRLVYAYPPSPARGEEWTFVDPDTGDGLTRAQAEARAFPPSR